MPLSFFQYAPPRHHQELVGQSDEFEHTFGGSPASFGIQFVNCEPLHLLYRLNQADPAVAAGLPGIRWLPLCYHFCYASFESDLIYRVRSDTEVELISPLDAERDQDFPWKGFPASFPPSGAAFQQVSYDPTTAEDALRLAAIFGFDHLSDHQMKRAVEIADETSSIIREWDLPDWTPEDIVRCAYPEPFVQGAPSKSCGNPNCSAEIAYQTEDVTIEFDETDGLELLRQTSVKRTTRDVRRNSMHVFAVHQPDESDNRIWPHVQLVFQVCEVCHCIRVTNQCT